jgi:hypothetical protein
MNKLLLFFAVLFTVRILRNVLAVIREKIALSNNMIVIESDHISNEDLKRAEVKMFWLQPPIGWPGLSFRIVLRVRATGTVPVLLFYSIKSPSFTPDGCRYISS